MSASDGDSDVITKYKVKDATGGNSFYVSGSAVVAHPRDYEFNASALSTLSIKGERSGGEQTLQIAAYDGKDWESGEVLNLIMAGLPVVTIDNQTLKFNTVEHLSLVSVSDVDKDTITKYESRLQQALVLCEWWCRVLWQ